MHKGERFNSISHMAGAALAGVGLVCLVVSAARQGDTWKIVSCSIYGFILLLLYTISTLYHSVQGKAKSVFRKLDHLSIYLMIAGTYTPLTLITLRGTFGWWLFGTIWLLAVLGMILDLFLPMKRRILPVIIYIIMGWLIVIAFKPLLQALPVLGTGLLIAGGLFYTVGVVFFALDKKVPHFHGVWHLFVLAGSLSHFFTVFLYVV